MGHTKPELLRDLSNELEIIRKLDGLKEKGSGIFYYKAIPFLHFHDKDGKRWAHVKFQQDWNELNINFNASETQRRSFLANVKKAHKFFQVKNESIRDREKKVNDKATMNDLNTQVLIIGAGPTGLTAAACLAKNGIKVRIIDKNEERSDKSRALGVQSGTLECFDHFLDSKISEQMISCGFPARSASIHINDKDPIEVNLSTILPPYDFILVLEQSETERILEEYLSSLGVTVERNTDLLEIREDGDVILAKVKLPNGQTEPISTSFAIGCDGAHSIVRQQLKIPFEGSQYSGDFILGDVKIKWQWSYQSIRVFVSEKGVMVSFPMTKGIYRLILIPKVPKPSDSQDISLEDFRSTVTMLSGNQIEVLESRWLTRFRVHRRIVESFQKGRIFLAGDAAHIHSPAGGQGMNIGIQEAMNLSLKIKAVLKGEKEMESLEEYEKERRPIAKMVLRGTDFAFRMALIKENSLVRWSRNSLLPKVVKAKWLQKHIVRAISEVKIARKEIKRRNQNVGVSP